jgi:predicted Zn-dependent peptidase
LRRLLAGAPAVLLAFPAPLCAQEEVDHSLPNGLEVRARRLANIGIVRARLVLTIDEGPGSPAPAGTARLMAEVLPRLGSGGMDRAAVEALRDLSGVSSRVDASGGWISRTFESLPANVEMMFQLLADGSLRPAWAKSDGLPEILARAQEGRAGGSPSEAPMDQGRFVALWSGSVRRPKRAVLSVEGDIESIPLRRSVAQNFGPWEGVRRVADGSSPATEAME